MGGDKGLKQGGSYVYEKEEEICRTGFFWMQKIGFCSPGHKSNLEDSLESGLPTQPLDKVYYWDP